MKRLILIVLTIVLTCCGKQSPKDYVTLSGNIKNQNSDSLCIYQRGIIKTIKVDVNGSFSDTLKVSEGKYYIFDGKEQSTIYLKNGFDLQLSLDTKQFDESISFKGTGSEPNNYLAKRALLQEELIDYKYLFSLDKTAFYAEVDKIIKAYQDLLSEFENLNPSFIADQNKEINSIKDQATSVYNKKMELLAMKGKQSPKFTDYLNYKGGNTSLDDFKGNYVYIDLWATWCAPCKKEIPFLKEVEKQYHDKKIKFVSISIDKKSAFKTWQNMVSELNLTGVQLFAGDDKEFLSSYKVSGIPRFILIDPEGKVINADAPRPSSDELTNLFNTLKI